MMVDVKKTLMLVSLVSLLSLAASPAAARPSGLVQAPVVGAEKPTTFPRPTSWPGGPVLSDEPCPECG